MRAHLGTFVSFTCAAVSVCVLSVESPRLASCLHTPNAAECVQIHMCHEGHSQLCFAFQKMDAGERSIAKQSRRGAVLPLAASWDASVPAVHIFWIHVSPAAEEMGSSLGSCAVGA